MMFEDVVVAIEVCALSFSQSTRLSHALYSVIVSFMVFIGEVNEQTSFLHNNATSSTQ